MPQGTEFFNGIALGESLRRSALRMAKYSNSPISVFLEMPTGEFSCWMKIMNAEIDLENEAAKKAANKK